MAWTDLPDAVLTRLTTYLNQQSLVNLAQTNYKFYTPCLRRLYRTLLIGREPAAPELATAEDFGETLATVIYGYRHQSDKMVSKASQVKMLTARLLVLNTALDINPALAGYIEAITVDIDDADVDEALLKQLNRLTQRREVSLTKWVATTNIGGLELPQAKVATAWTQPQVDDATEGVYVMDLSLEVAQLPLLLRTLVLPVDNFTKLANQAPIDSMSNLTTFRWVLDNVDDAGDLLIRVNWRQIRALELVITAGPDTVLEVLEVVPPLPNLKRLAIVQQSPEYNTHAANELYDVAVLGLVTAVVATLPQLKYLALVHDVPEHGNFSDGYEGNYLRRKSILGHHLARVVSAARGPVAVSMPTLLALLACYDQAMNNMLWNGCHCRHCSQYLGVIDEFLLHHRYYLPQQKGYKDINSLLLFRTVGEAMKQRLVREPTWLFSDTVPLLDAVWDFHRTFGRDFRCYAGNVHDDGFEHDDVDASEPLSYRCALWTPFVYHQGVPKAMAHYLTTLVVLVVNLERDNAEDEVIGRMLNDGGDSDFRVNMGLVQMSGINFWVGTEPNGTHCFAY